MTELLTMSCGKKQLVHSVFNFWLSLNTDSAVMSLQQIWSIDDLEKFLAIAFQSVLYATFFLLPGKGEGVFPTLWHGVEDSAEDGETFNNLTRKEGRKKPMEVE